VMYLNVVPVLDIQGLIRRETDTHAILAIFCMEASLYWIALCTALNE
jgi:hypothetical protein